MKKHIKNTVVATIATAIITGSVVGVYAMSDEDFKNTFLHQIQASESLSDEELHSLEEELQDISRDDILASLNEEIAALEDTDLQTVLKSDFAKLETITQGDSFFSATENMYEKLDSYYMENSDNWGGDMAQDFEEEKVYILESLEEEKMYLDNQDLVSQVEDTMKVLEQETDENTFFTTLDALYGKLDQYYEVTEGIDADIEELDFQDMKNDVIDGLKNEREHIESTEVQTSIDTTITLLETETDEEVFFQTLDGIYNTLDTYYESIGGEVISQEEFLDEDISFEAIKDSVLGSLTQELSDIDNDTLKTKVQSGVETLTQEQNEAQFFDVLNALYAELDNYYDEYNGGEDLNEAGNTQK